MQIRNLPVATTPLTGLERIPVYQTGAIDDVYVTPTNIANMPVPSRQEPSNDYTAQVSDIGVVVELTGTNPIVRLPIETVVAFYDGCLLQFQHFATGRPTFVANFGVTVTWPKAADNVTDCKILRAPGSPISLRKRVGIGLWVAEGDLVST